MRHLSHVVVQSCREESLWMSLGFLLQFLSYHSRIPNNAYDHDIEGSHRARKLAELMTH